MKSTIALLVACLLVASACSSFAQKPYAGSYYASVAITIGPSAGVFGQGGATIFSSGLMTATVFYVGVGGSDTFTGVVDRKGILTLDAPNLGTARIFRSGKFRFAFSTFGSSFAGGNFYLTNYQ
jgi:hypothetical protein